MRVHIPIEMSSMFDLPKLYFFLKKFCNLIFRSYAISVLLNFDFPHSELRPSRAFSRFHLPGQLSRTICYSSTRFIVTSEFRPFSTKNFEVRTNPPNGQSQNSLSVKEEEGLHACLRLIHTFEICPRSLSEKK